MFQQEINQYLTTHHYTRIDLKAVLFDMDGDLIDSMKNHATAWHKAMKQYGMSLSKEEAYLHEDVPVRQPSTSSAKEKEAMRPMKKKSNESTRPRATYSISCPKPTLCPVHSRS